jgi:hypothetical protein
MSYTGIIVSEEEINLMVGELVDATGNTEANHNYLVAHAEAYLSTLVKYDIKTNWASLSSVYKVLFSEWAARYCAISLILYNTGGYNDLIEAEDMCTSHFYRMQKIEELLAKDEFRDFLGI